jgi:hypothetical protein
MHTYLPTMLSLVAAVDGITVGLRGDGAIACFGLVDVTAREEEPVTTEEAETAVRAACKCGDAMVRAIDAVVNRVLERGGVRGGLQMGVGIDVGNIVATNIGLGGATELTAYGNCVNKCCERSFGNNMVVLTLEARRMFPKGGGGTQFERYPNKDDAYILRYPESYTTLE